MRIGILSLLLLVLAACESREEAFCRAFVESRVKNAGGAFDHISATTVDRAISREAAIRMLYPNYGGDKAFYKQRPPEALAIIDRIGMTRTTERSVTLSYRARHDDRESMASEKCSFLKLNDDPQYLLERHLYQLQISRVIAEEKGRPIGCCLITDAAVR